MQNYLSDDTVLNIINVKFISLSSDEVKTTNTYLHKALNTLINKMKETNSLFNKTYKKLIYCGSFYKGTKVGKPNEYDLNLVFELPVPPENITLYSTKPAFTQIKIRINNTSNSLNNVPLKYRLSDTEKRLLNRLVTNDFLNTDKFRQWIEGILSNVIEALPRDGNCSKLIVEDKDGCSRFRIKKSGPAFTMILNTPNGKTIDIDLAPALVFRRNNIHGSTARLNTLNNYENKEWFAIPLPSYKTAFPEAVHWRMSFYLQENEILARNGRVKPVIRLMKKLRDMENWKSMASYFIETLMLHKLSNLQQDLNATSLTLLFVTMLKELQSACQQHKIQYFWDTGYNVLVKISEREMSNIANRLKNIIQNIEKHAMENKFVIAEYLLNKSELNILRSEYDTKRNQLSNVNTVNNTINDMTNEIHDLHIDTTAGDEGQRQYCYIL